MTTAENAFFHPQICGGNRLPARHLLGALRNLNFKDNVSPAVLTGARLGSGMSLDKNFKEKEKEKEKEGLLPARELNFLKADRCTGASPATQTWHRGSSQARCGTCTCY